MKTFTFLISIFLLFGSFSTKAQTSTYTVSGPTRGQGSLLNTERTNNNNGWAMIHLYNAYGGASVNSWSSAQSIGFPFSFYGSPATHFCVSKNYLLTFDTTVAGTTVNSSITTDNTALPHADLPDNTIAYFWGGFNPSLGTNDAVQMKTFGTTPNRQLWIKNFSYKHEAQGFSYNFVVLEETTHKIYVVDAQWGSQGVGSYTVGVQLNSTTAIQHPNSPNISSINAGSYTPWPNVDYYEFTPLSLVNDDAGIFSLDAPGSSTVPGSQSVQVSIKNHGINNLDSVRVNWSVDGVAQTSHSWTGSLAPGAVAAAVNIGSYNFTPGNPTLKIWTSNPNGNADNNTFNDTLETSLIVCGLISGTYTLGGLVGPNNIKDFNSLATLLSNCGISGPVIIKVAPGTYREQLTLGNIAGVSQSNTIVIDGGDSSLVRLTHDGSTSNATVAFDSTSYISLRNITLENTKSSPAAWVVHLQNTDHIVIDSCLIEQPVNTTSNRGGIVGSGSLINAFTITTNKHLTVSDNIITGGYYGIVLEGDTSTSDEDVGNHILRNRFIDIHYYGILVDEQDSLMISGNVIENVNSSSSYGIYCEDITDFEITANNLTDCGSGIAVQGATSSGTARSLIANNMVYAPGGIGIGMTAYSSIPISQVNIYHNTAVGNPAIEFFSSNYSDITLYNNIFSNPNGVALDASLPSLPSTIDIDYNLYHYQASGNIAKNRSTSYANLVAWQTAKPALNAHSVEGDPMFVRKTAPADLHLLGTLANDIGKGSLGINFDIDGDRRLLPPSTQVDMGADEYDPASCLPPTGLSASATSPTTVQLSWIAGGSSSWNLEWGTAGFTPGSGTFVYDVLNPYTVTSLTSLVFYDFYVQDSCGVGDVSIWRGPFSFATLCPSLSPAILPIVEDFESASGTYLRNREVLCAPTYKWSYETSLANKGRLRFAVFGLANNGSSAATLDKNPSQGGLAINYLILTANLSNYSTSSLLALDFSHIHHGDESHANDRVWIRGSNTDAWVQIYNLYANRGRGGYYNQVRDLDIDSTLANATPPQRVSSTFQVRFGQEGILSAHYGSGLRATNDGYSFDDIIIWEKQCPYPSSLMASNITDTSTELSWSSGGASHWNLEYGISGFTPGTGNFLHNVSNPHILRGLLANTGYEFYVQDSCGVDTVSRWIGPAFFAMLCPSLSPATLPIVEDFESASGTYQRNREVLCYPTYKWSYETSLADEGRLRFAVLGFANNGSSAATLDKSIFAGVVVTNYLIMTANLSNYNSSSALELEFSYMHHREVDHPNDKVWIRGSDTDLWINIYDLYANQGTAGIYNQVIGLDIDSILANALPSQRVSSTFQLRFGQEDKFRANSLQLNAGFSFDDIAIRETCPSPTNLTATNITQTSATLSWVAGGASNWDLEYGLSGFTLGRGTQIHTTIPSYTVSGLTPGMGYDFYVRSTCGLSYASSWAGPHTFTTLSATLPCPSPSSLGATHITQTSARLSWMSGGASNWSLEWGTVNFALGSGNFLPNVAPTHYTLSGLIPGTSYQFYVRDSCGVGHVSSWVGPYTFTTLSATLPCPSPSSLLASNITQTSAALSWITGGASNWNMEYGIQGFIPGSGTFVYNVPNPYTLSGLTLGTDYDFYVRDSCGVGHVSSWAGPHTFTTLSATLPCPSPSSLLASNITQTSAALSWVIGGASNWNMEYGIQSFTPGSGTFVYNVPNPYTLSGLTPGTDYDFYVRDSCGVSHVSSWAGPHTFTTLSATLPCPSPSSLLASNITQTSAALSWVTGGASNWNMEYGIQGFIPGSGTFVYNVPNPYTLSGLTPGTDYDFYVRDSCGVSHVSSWAGPHTFTTLSATLPCPSPSSLSATQITQTNATLSWVTGGASNWDLEYGLSGFTLGSGTRISTTTPSYTVSGLTPGRSYQFYVRDSCGVGHVSSWAGPHTFRTLGCLSPTGLKLDIITEITATVSWTSGGASNWNIEYGPINFPLGSGIFLYNVSSPRTLRGLKPNTFYDVYVQDSCNVGNVSNWAGPLSIKTIIGIDELLERSFRIYPNPSEGVFKLEFSSSLGEDMEIRITNMMGQIVLEDEIESFSGSYRKRLEMGAYGSGVYLLQLITERATVNRRIILQ